MKTMCSLHLFHLEPTGSKTYMGFSLIFQESSSLRNIPVVIMSSENVPSRISRWEEEILHHFFLFSFFFPMNMFLKWNSYDYLQLTTTDAWRKEQKNFSWSLWGCQIWTSLNPTWRRPSWKTKSKEQQKRLKTQKFYSNKHQKSKVLRQSQSHIHNQL